ncbi:MAG: glycosyltransferase family 4 protein [Candidatus Hermodarchaeota archaeon]
MIQILVYTREFPTYKNQGKGIFVFRKWLECSRIYPNIKIAIFPIHERSECSNHSFPFRKVRCIHYTRMLKANYLSIILSSIIAYLIIILRSFVFLLQSKFDFIVVEWANPVEIGIALCVARIKKKKIIVLPKGTDIRILPFKFSPYLKLMTYLLKKVDGIQVNSQNMQSILLKYYNSDKKVINVNYEGFFPGLHSISDKCNKYKTLLTSLIKSNKNIFAMIGRFDRSKMQLELVKGVAELKREDVVLFLIGSGPEERIKHITKIISDLELSKQVFITGRISDSCLKVFLQIIPCFFHISRSESFPVAILEEMSFGRVVIASPVGGIPEMFSSGAGILLNENNEKSIVEALQNLLNGKYDLQRISKLAKEKAWKDFHVEKQVRRTVEYLSRL